jgi:putative tryptophan/tyrosine transport system substrate-binding protein
MKRRAFITLLGAAAAWPLAARAQEPGRIYRLGCLHASPRDAPHHLALFEELRRLGFIDGQNLVVDAAGYGMSAERFAVHAADLAKARVDVILAGGDASVRAAQRATTSIPILALTDDMVGQGFVHSLGQPGGNTTGVTLLASELDGKRQEILIEAVPGVRRIAALVDSNTTTPSRLVALKEAARARGVELSKRGRGRPQSRSDSQSASFRCAGKPPYLAPLLRGHSGRRISRSLLWQGSSG